MWCVLPSPSNSVLYQEVTTIISNPCGLLVGGGQARNTKPTKIGWEALCLHIMTGKAVRRRSEIGATLVVFTPKPSALNPNP